MAVAPTDIISQVDSKIQSIITNDLNSALSAFNQGISFLNDEFNNLVKGAFAFVDNEFSPLTYGNLSGSEAVLYFKARQQVPIIVSDGIKIALATYVFSLAMDSVPTLRGSTLLNIAVFIQELYAVNKAIDAFNSNIVGAGIAEPLRQYYNQIFRPTDIDIQTGIDLYYKGLITQTDLFIILTKNGYGDKRANLIIAGSAEPLGISQLIRLAKIAPLSPDYILTTLKKNRFVGADLSNAYQAVQLDEVRNQLDAFIGDAITIYADGLISDSLFDQYLKFGLVQGNAIIAVKNVAGIKLTTLLIKQRVTILTSAFKQGFLDQTTYKNALDVLGLQPLESNNIFIQSLLDVGINPTELLTFPSLLFLMPSGMSFAFNIS